MELTQNLKNKDTEFKVFHLIGSELKDKNIYESSFLIKFISRTEGSKAELKQKLGL